MKESDEEQFFKFTRMTVNQFNKLLGIVSPYLERKWVRSDQIYPEERLLITLW